MTSTSCQPRERSALAAHLTAIQAASEQMAAARTRVDRVRAQVEGAEIALRTAQARVNGITERETAALREWSSAGAAWPPPASPTLEKERADAEVSMAEALKAIGALQGLLTEAEGELSRLARAFSDLSNQTDDHVRAAIETDMTAAVDRLAAAYAAAANAEAIVAGARSFIASHGAQLRNRGADSRVTAWFQLGERIAAAYSKLQPPMLSPKDQAAAAANWASLSQALASNAGSQLKDHAHAQ